MGFNSTCPHERQPPADPVPFFANGQVNFKAHDVGWLVAGIFTLITWVASIWLILKHLTYYTCPPQQRHIVRMLFMPPIYATISFAGYLFYTEVSGVQAMRALRCELNMMCRAGNLLRNNPRLLRGSRHYVLLLPPPPVRRRHAH